MYAILPFFICIHSFVEGGEGVYIFRVRLQSVLFYHHFAESVSSQRQREICPRRGPRKIYLYSLNIFQHYMHLLTRPIRLYR